MAKVNLPPALWSGKQKSVDTGKTKKAVVVTYDKGGFLRHTGCFVDQKWLVVSTVFFM